MKVRCRLDGMVMTARMELLKVGGARPRFALLVNDPIGRRFAVGRLEAALGYELIESTPEEVVTIRLAGFRLSRANCQGRPWRCIANLLCAMRNREARAARRRGPKDLMPHDSQAKIALRGQTSGHGSTELHPRKAAQRGEPASGRGHAPKSKTPGPRRKAHGHRHRSSSA